MEFLLFGEVQLRVAGEPLDVGTPRRQAVLAALVIDAGRPVPIETLIDRRAQKKSANRTRRPTE